MMLLLFTLNSSNVQFFSSYEQNCSKRIYSIMITHIFHYLFIPQASFGHAAGYFVFFDQSVYDIHRFFSPFTMILPAWILEYARISKYH